MQLQRKQQAIKNKAKGNRLGHVPVVADDVEVAPAEVVCFAVFVVTGIVVLVVGTVNGIETE